MIGLGYVGLTLAVALAAEGIITLGYDRIADLTARLATRDPAIQEPGVAATLRALPAGAFTATSELPDRLPPAVVVCVGTPVNPTTHEPDLSQLEAALDAIAPRIEAHTVVMIRSTVPVGTTEGLIRERLAQTMTAPRLVFCPERTIQGKALHELATLPQVVGGRDPEALAAACRLFARLGSEVITVSSASAAEMVKLVCNSHTDVLYGFGNEVALMASALGLDASEVIAAANLRYPRPDLARPGFVGGSCLTKDPYLLAGSVRARGYEPVLIPAARRLNEQVPLHVAERVLTLLAQAAADPRASTLLLAGIAYKGRPITDDTRGSAAAILGEYLPGMVGELLGHDYLVADDRIRELGSEPVELAAGCCRAQALLLLTDHPHYSQEDVAALVTSMCPPRVIYDVWGIWREAIAELSGVDHVYMRLGDD